MPCGSTGGQSRPVLAEGVLDQDLVSLEGEDINHAGFNAGTVCIGTTEGGLGKAAIAGDNVGAVAPGGIGDIDPGRFKALAYSLATDMAGSKHVRPGDGVKLTVVSHHAHQCINIVGVPGSTECFQKLDFLFVAHGESLLSNERKTGWSGG